MRRREFILLAGAAALSSPYARAQQDKVPRIGFLSPATALSARDKAFLQELEALGYVDGETVHIEYRFAQGDFDRLPELAAELVGLNVEVIAAVVTQASLAARRATDSIPIVMLAVSDPVASGLTESLARPSGNVTGTASMSAEVVGKSLETLSEVVPNLRRVAILWNPANAVFQQQMLSEADHAATLLGLQVEVFGVEGPDDLQGAFAAMGGSGVDGLLVLGDPILVRHHKRIIELAGEARLPAIYSIREIAEAGGLMAYGPMMEERFRRAATYVDRLLKGARPGDLPIEQPTQFEFVINLNTAAALGINLPLPLVARADEVIE